MKNIFKPALLLFIVGVILMFLGLGTQTSGHRSGNALLYLGVAFIGVYWIVGIGNVVRAKDLESFQKIFWMIVVISVPVLGALTFHILHQQEGKIIT